ncbi:MAG TPA: ubiquinol-cytochrome c reductase iron-sulfur subunit, partial [Anaerolineales bacterium]
SRRDFMKMITGAVGGIITAAIGVPVIGYLIDPALRAGGKEAWIPIGKIEKIPVNIPTPFSFTRTQVNGWERTGTSFGGFVIRRSEDPKDILILSSRCTHLGCTVSWKDDAREFICPCHDAKFDEQGNVLDGPPPRPLNRYTEFKVDGDGNLLIFFKEG